MVDGKPTPNGLKPNGPTTEGDMPGRENSGSDASTDPTSDLQHPSEAPTPQGAEIMVIDDTLIEETSIPRDWRKVYLDCLIRQELPSDHTEARSVVRRSKSFTVIDGELYRRSVWGILQPCIPIE